MVCITCNQWDLRILWYPTRRLWVANAIKISLLEFHYLNLLEFILYLLSKWCHTHFIILSISCEDSLFPFCIYRNGSSANLPKLPNKISFWEIRFPSGKSCWKEMGLGYLSDLGMHEKVYQQMITVTSGRQLFPQKSLETR